MIGILLALQVNNWNEGRKARQQFKQGMLGLAEDIRKDTSIIQNYISFLKDQEEAAIYIIPILESKEKKIMDSLKFNTAFGYMSRALTMDYNTEIWDEIRKSGMHKKYGAPYLNEKIQTYYHGYSRYAQNWESARDIRIESRWLKYELLTQKDLDNWSSDNPRPFSKNGYEAIFNKKRVVELTKAIYYSSTIFIEYFETSKAQAVDVLKRIEAIYDPLKGDFQ